MRKFLLCNLVENINLYICAKFCGVRALRGRDQRGGGGAKLAPPPPRLCSFKIARAN